MNFLWPAFLTAALLIGLPILLHLLRQKPRQEVRFPSLRFLRNVVLQESKKHRIRRWLVLALRCLVILLIAAAFARPFFGSKLNPANRAVVVLIDNSFSMQSGDRWKEAIDRARSETQSLQPGDRLGVMLMNPRPTWIAPLSGDLEAGRAAIASARPGYSATRYGPALKLAGSILEAAPESERKIIWVGDHQATGWRDVDFNQPLPPGIELSFSPNPVKPERQAAIRDARIRAAGDRLVVDVVIQSFAPAKDSRTLSVFHGTDLVANRPVDLRSGEPLAISLETKADAKSVDALTIQLNTDDLRVDDVRYAVLGSREGSPVWLSPPRKMEDADYLAGALDAVRELNLQTFKVTPWSGATDGMRGVALLRGGEPFSDQALSQLEGFLKNGGAAWIQLDGSEKAIAWLKRQGIEVTSVPADALKLRDWDLDHPLLAPFKGNNLLPLLSLQFQKGWGLKGESLVPIARWGNQSIGLAEFSFGEGRVLLSGFDPSRRADSTWPISSAFVPFVHGATAWLAQGTEQAVRGTVGSPLNLPAEGRWELVEGPEPIPPSMVAKSVTPTAPGIYQLTAGAQKWRYAINVPEEESNLALWPASGDWKRLQSTEARPATSVTSGAASGLLPSAQLDWIWWWLAFLVFFLLLVELGISNRTAS